jgi:hypothetical protein
MPIVIVDTSLLGVSQHLVGFRSLLKILLCLFTSGIAVRVVFQGELPIIRLELFRSGISINTKDIVIVTLRDLRLPLECILASCSSALTNTIL